MTTNIIKSRLNKDDTNMSAVVTTNTVFEAFIEADKAMKELPAAREELAQTQAKLANLEDSTNRLAEAHSSALRDIAELRATLAAKEAELAQASFHLSAMEAKHRSLRSILSGDDDLGHHVGSLANSPISQQQADEAGSQGTETGISSEYIAEYERAKSSEVFPANNPELQGRTGERSSGSGDGSKASGQSESDPTTRSTDTFASQTGTDGTVSETSLSQSETTGESASHPTESGHTDTSGTTASTEGESAADPTSGQTTTGPLVNDTLTPGTSHNPSASPAPGVADHMGEGSFGGHGQSAQETMSSSSEAATTANPPLAFAGQPSTRKPDGMEWGYWIVNGGEAPLWMSYQSVDILRRDYAQWAGHATKSAHAAE